MVRGRCRSFLPLSFLAAAALSEAATYVPVTDASLVDRSPLAVIGRVEGTEWSGRATLVRVAIERVLRGSLSSQIITVSVPGSDTFIVPGMPRFAAAQRVILFLASHPDGNFRIVELMLGAFKERTVARSAETRAQRDLGGSTSVGDSQVEPARDFGEFANWIEARSRGEQKAPVTYERPASELSAEAAVAVSAPYSLLGTARWTQFDTGQTINWGIRFAGTTPAVSFTTAVNSFNTRDDVVISITYVGSQPTGTGIGHTDGLNTVHMNDPFGEIAGTYSCAGGGVLAIGGWGTNGTTHTYKGITHTTITEGDIVTQDGVDCAFDDFSGQYGVQVLGHELGHAIGIGHSCGDAGSGTCVVPSDQNDALMRASAHNDNRGARFSPDDVNALKSLYQRAIWVSSPTVTEGDSGFNFMTFTVTLGWSYTSLSNLVTVNYYTTSSGSRPAGEGKDYTAASGTLTFLPFETSLNVTVNIAGDAIYEGPETLELNLWGPANAGLRDQTATGTIADNESPPAVSIGNASRTEGNSLSSTMGFSVSQSRYSEFATTVTAATSNLTATAGSDYVAKTQTVTIPAGQLVASFDVLIYGDTTVEASETFRVTLSNPLNATLSDALADGTITNDDVGAPAVSTPTSASVTATTATLGGTVSSDGGSAILERGIAYSATTTNSNPAVGGTGVTKAVATGTTGIFTTNVTGLLPGTAYSLRAFARNAVGTSYSALATFAALANVPGAPTIGTATAGDATVSVAFTAPASNGGATITSYTATCGSRTGSGSGSPITVTGLTNGVAVTCTVVATNSRGNSAASAASNSATPNFAGTSIPRLKNISTRGKVETGDNIMIGGFIVGGSGPKKVVITGRGPSLAAHGVSGTLANPAIRLFSGATAIEFNDNWQTAANAAEITASTFAPTNPQEAAILTTVTPGVPYTVHLTGVGDTTGIAIVEVFELDVPENPLLNISTRGRVQTADDVMIGGFIIQGSASQQVLITARGPSLAAAPFNLTGVLADPTIELYAAGTPTPIATNDNWANDSAAAGVTASGNAPTNALESALLRTLAPGAYTVIVRGLNGGTGIGIVEVFKK